MYFSFHILIVSILIIITKGTYSDDPEKPHVFVADVLDKATDWLRKDLPSYTKSMTEIKEKGISTIFSSLTTQQQPQEPLEDPKTFENANIRSLDEVKAQKINYDLMNGKHLITKEQIEMKGNEIKEMENFREQKIKEENFPTFTDVLHEIGGGMKSVKDYMEESLVERFEKKKIMDELKVSVKVDERDPFSQIWDATRGYFSGVQSPQIKFDPRYIEAKKIEFEKELFHDILPIPDPPKPTTASLTDLDKINHEGDYVHAINGPIIEFPKMEWKKNKKSNTQLSVSSNIQRTHSSSSSSEQNTQGPISDSHLNFDFSDQRSTVPKPFNAAPPIMFSKQPKKSEINLHPERWDRVTETINKGIYQLARNSPDAQTIQKHLDAATDKLEETFSKFYEEIKSATEKKHMENEYNNNNNNNNNNNPQKSFVPIKASTKKEINGQVKVSLTPQMKFDDVVSKKLSEKDIEFLKLKQQQAQTQPDVEQQQQQQQKLPSQQLVKGKANLKNVQTDFWI